MELVTKDITVEALRQIQGFEKLNDQELLKVAESIKELALILNLVPAVDQHLKK
jgi:hypothetical protein